MYKSKDDANSDIHVTRDFIFTTVSIVAIIVWLPF